MKPPNINECQLSHAMFKLQQNVGFINSKDYIFKYHILLNGIYNTFAKLRVRVYSVALTASYVISSEFVLLDPRLSSIDTGLPPATTMFLSYSTWMLFIPTSKDLTWYQLDTRNNHTDNKTVLDLNYNTIFI